MATDTQMVNIAAIYGSPRRKGNTATLLKSAVDGATAAGASVDEIVLRDYNISPCLEIYGCKKQGECVIKDDFQTVRDRVLACNGIIVATPVFFYTVSAHLKLFMDRCQSLWVNKYWVEQTPFNQWVPKRQGLVIAAGATKGKKLFDGMQLTMKYFFDVLDTAMWDSLLIRGLDFEGDARAHPEHLEAAYKRGELLAGELSKTA
ncbi:MAG: flavodoxin family protein [Thermodesulfobacteriota bacterium]|nr:flavodoxin family protein [Thermodesulfobacteriota bacterium]